MSQQALGEYIGKDRTTIVAIVDELEHAGLVERRRNPADRRAYALEVTTKGHDWLARAKPALLAAEDGLLEPLDDAERELLMELLQRVLFEPAPSSAEPVTPDRPQGGRGGVRRAASSARSPASACRGASRTARWSGPGRRSSPTSLGAFAARLVRDPASGAAAALRLPPAAARHRLLWRPDHLLDDAARDLRHARRRRRHPRRSPTRWRASSPASRSSCSRPAWSEGPGCAVSIGLSPRSGCSAAPERSPGCSSTARSPSRGRGRLPGRHADRQPARQPVLGVVVGAERRRRRPPLATGLLGSFTTFSTWIFESHRLAEDGEAGLDVREHRRSAWSPGSSWPGSGSRSEARCERPRWLQALGLSSASATRWPASSPSA